jgi:hypothetical protein
MFEPRRRRTGIDAVRDMDAVVLRIAQNVCDATMCIQRRRQGPAVVAATEYVTLPLPDAIQRQRNPYRQRGHAGADRLLIVGFDDEMDVIRHHGVVHDVDAKAS